MNFRGSIVKLMRRAFRERWAQRSRVMPIVLSCDCGHQWQVELSTRDAPAGASVSCPACGSAVPAAATDLPTATWQTDSLPEAPPAGTAPAGGRPRVPGYELLEELGRGGMGIVYKARQSKLNRIVALKVIRAGQLASADELDRFRLEAEAAAQLDHPHIVPVYEVGAVDGQHYFSMGYVAGHSLQEKLHNGPLPPRDAAALVRKIASAVQYAHEKGIVHRDLKPANVLIDDAGQPRVTDFGLAKRTESESSLTATGQVLGTPGYMPPEQAAGRLAEVGPRSDVYALGAMLYCLVTGRPPFQAASLMETLKLVLEEEPVAPRQLNRCVPRDLDTICLKCLEKDSSRRYATAADLADDLGRYFDGRPIAARPVGRMERGWRWCRRNPSATGTIAAVLLLVMGGFAVALWYVQDRAERTAEITSRTGRLELQIESALTDVESARQRALAVIGRPDEWGGVLATALSAQRRAEGFVAQEPEHIARPLQDDVQRSRSELDDAVRDQALAARIEAVLLDLAQLDRELKLINLEIVFPRLRDALAEYGLSAERLSADEAAARIRSRPQAVQPIICSAFDLCLLYAPAAEHDSATTAWMAEVLRSADQDSWRLKVRAAVAEQDLAGLEVLLGEPDVHSQPVPFLLSLARHLSAAGAIDLAYTFLRDVQRVRPNDYWANSDFGHACLKRGLLPQARDCAAAMVALRPLEPAAWTDLGITLQRSGDLPGAVDAHQRSVDLQPAYAIGYSNLSAALHDAGDHQRAEAAAQQAIALQSDFAAAYRNLGNALVNLDDVPGAVAAFQKAMELDPADFDTRNSYGFALMRSGNLSGAIAVFHQVTHEYPDLPKGYCNLGAALLNNDDLPGAIKAYWQAIDVRKDFAPAFVLLGSALSMDGDLPGAIDAFERAVELQPGDAMSHCNLGLCLKDQGEFVAALAALRRGHELGSKQAAWPIPSARYVAECERLVELDAQLLDVLTGRLEPEAAALGEFANVCYCKRRYADAVRLYRTAFDRQPQLADNLSKNWRYNAACAAALGGCAREKGEPGASEMDRAELRRQALEWLSADLEQWKHFLQQSPAQARGLAARFLPRWQVDADLGPVRDPDQLARLPDEERQRLAAFWDDVAQTIATVEHESGK